ncbi:hypothetical protein C0J50_14119 [Silurus asotus]|uniref:ribonuclease H n=1 Tax=Silurus asotus TaxID=30991 RepID=A0AAD5FS41_SILAS|nr:hypothetical protein C0J50_14119 [Silurus asotus]
MRITNKNFIPDRSRPGLTTTATGIVSRQGTGGNWATVGRRRKRRGGRRLQRRQGKEQCRRVEVRVGTLNVGTMTGKGREVADMMERRKVDMLCVQETKWKGSKARNIGGGFKLFYHGVDGKRNGVGVILKEEYSKSVVEVKRVSDRVMIVKVEVEGMMINVISAYAPQVGCEMEEKERFWSELDEVVDGVPRKERLVIGADFNGHVGEGNRGDEEVMGRYGFKERNVEGQMVVDFAKRMEMAVVNTYFKKKEDHRVTYKSGGRCTQVDYVLCRRCNLKEIGDCKVLAGDSVARQHRMVVCRMVLEVKKKRRRVRTERRIRWWKLKEEECSVRFREEVRERLSGVKEVLDDWATTAGVMREAARKVLGVTSGNRKEDKETWWWNEEVQESIRRKRLAKQKWDRQSDEKSRQEYKEMRQQVKRDVAKAKEKAYEELYERLDTKEGEKDLYRLARQRDRAGKDVLQVRAVKDGEGNVLTSEESVLRRWREYFEQLMNEENQRERRLDDVELVKQDVDRISKEEVRAAIKRMKSGKSVGPDDIPVEAWRCLGEMAVEFLTRLFNRILEGEKMPEEWRRSVLVPIFKHKGDVQTCSNYRGIKLISHTMKLWERVVEARLREEVTICEQQYGFMPRKSTTDALFALRMLMEKYREGQKELHCVFVDLEKAYDRVPREELWYCMRKSGVSEKYVRVVQDMYEGSVTAVKCAVGTTDWFRVKVGLHQGSALSPFLFAVVMDRLTDEVRQESPWTMMFADDIVICCESREQVEESLERWRYALERRGMKLSRSKTEYMCVNEREGSGVVRLQGEELQKVEEFREAGLTTAFSPGASSTVLHISPSEENARELADSSQPLLYEELFEVVTRAMSKLDLPWPVKKRHRKAQKQVIATRSAWEGPRGPWQHFKPKKEQAGLRVTLSSNKWAVHIQEARLLALPQDVLQSMAPLQQVAPSTSAQKIAADGGGPAPFRRPRRLQGTAPAIWGQKNQAVWHLDVLDCMKELGLRLNAGKSVLSPALRTTFLGVMWNSTRLHGCLPPRLKSSSLQSGDFGEQRSVAPARKEDLRDVVSRVRRELYL